MCSATKRARACDGFEKIEENKKKWSRQTMRTGRIEIHQQRRAHDEWCVSGWRLTKNERQKAKYIHTQTQSKNNNWNGPLMMASCINKLKSMVDLVEPFVSEWKLVTVSVSTGQRSSLVLDSDAASVHSRRKHRTLTHTHIYEYMCVRARLIER